MDRRKQNMAQRPIFEDETQGQANPGSDTEEFKWFAPTLPENLGIDKEPWKNFIVTVKKNVLAKTEEKSEDLASLISPTKVQFLLKNMLESLNMKLQEHKCCIGKVVEGEVLFLYPEKDIRNTDEIFDVIVSILEEMVEKISSRSVVISQAEIADEIFEYACKHVDQEKALILSDGGKRILLIGEKTTVESSCQDLKEFVKERQTIAREIQLQDVLSALLLKNLEFENYFENGSMTDFEIKFDSKVVVIQRVNATDMDQFVKNMNFFLKSIFSTKCGTFDQGVAKLIRNESVQKYLQQQIQSELKHFFIDWKDSDVICYTRTEKDGKLALSVFKTRFQTITLSRPFSMSVQFKEIHQAFKEHCLVLVSDEETCDIIATDVVACKLLTAATRNKTKMFEKLNVAQKMEPQSDGTLTQGKDQISVKPQKIVKEVAENEVKSKPTVTMEEPTVKTKHKEGEKVAEPVQNEKNSEKTKVIMNTVKTKPKVVKKGPELKYKYKEDQWSPINLEGKRVYNREFLLHLQHSTYSQIKPAGLPDLPEIILDEPYRSADQLPTQGFNFTPGFVRGRQPPSQPMIQLLPENYRQIPPPGYPNLPQLSVNASEFIPRIPSSNRNQSNLFDDFQRLFNISLSHMNTQYDAPASEQILMEFSSTLHTLTIQPGNIEEYMDPLIDLLKKIRDGDIVQQMVEILFEQSIAEPNFRYTGALVCRYLSKQLKNTKAFANFRGLFLTRCKEEYLKREELVSENLSRLCGFTMFIRELFLNLEIETQDGHSDKIGIFRFVLRDLLLTLLSNPTDETVKTASKVLKLTGATIEDTAYLNKPGEGSFDAVYLRVRQLESFPHLNQTTKLLVKSVLSQKDNNWGRRESSSLSVPNPPPSYPSQSQPPYQPPTQNMYPQNPQIQNIAQRWGIQKTTIPMANVQNQLIMLLTKHVSTNEDIFDWIEENLDDVATKTNQFVRALMTSVCSSAISGSGIRAKVVPREIKNRGALLKKYLNHQTYFELEALYALQSLVHSLGHPPGVLRTLFDTLFDEDIISEDTFNQWEKSTDPAEQEGKDVAMKQVRQFFQWLREPEDDSDS